VEYSVFVTEAEAIPPLLKFIALIMHWLLRPPLQKKVIRKTQFSNTSEIKAEGGREEGGGGKGREGGRGREEGEGGGGGRGGRRGIAITLRLMLL
jgi:hypothetical protein